MKKILMIAMIASLAIFTACNDEETFEMPTVTAPTAQEVEVSEEVDVTFNFTADAGFKSASVSATNGTAVIKTNATANSKTGAIVVTYTAGNEIGAGSVALTITDKEDQAVTSVSVISVLEEQIIFRITGNITSNTTWETGKVYILESRIAVISGVTLTIQPGVVVKGQAGTSSNATALLIARGATLLAEGTATQPIIFTSIADEIMPGEVESPNLDPDINGLWGGLLILGNAPISGDAQSLQIEGIPASDPNGLYGGTSATDNSGIIKYVSIRHGGANIGEGNEINGLTLGGVGSGTVIENIEVVANQDDGIELFGGTVSVKNILIWNTGDDALDTDQAWVGTIDNFIVVNPGDEGMELDGPEGPAASTNFTIKNGSVYAGAAEGLVDNDANTNGNIENVYFFGLTVGQDFDQLPTEYTVTISGLEATLPASTTLADFFKGGSDAFATAVAAGANTVGGDLTKFADWSWAEVSGALADF